MLLLIIILHLYFFLNVLFFKSELFYLIIKLPDFCFERIDTFFINRVDRIREPTLKIMDFRFGFGKLVPHFSDLGVEAIDLGITGFWVLKYCADVDSSIWLRMFENAFIHLLVNLFTNFLYLFFATIYRFLNFPYLLDST